MCREFGYKIEKGGRQQPARRKIQAHTQCSADALLEDVRWMDAGSMGSDGGIGGAGMGVKCLNVWNEVAWTDDCDVCH